MEQTNQAQQQQQQAAQHQQQQQPPRLTTFRFRRSLVMKTHARATLFRLISARRSPGIEMRPFILTGPPRSGTSLLTALLTRKPNVVVVNEPIVLTDPFLRSGSPSQLLRGFMNEVARKAVREGRLTTKVDPGSPGRPTTDTANVGADRQDITINIDRTRPLCVGVKHPMSFMEFLDELLSGWSDLRAIVIVRDPGPTIRSWRETGYGWQPGLDDRSIGPLRRIYDLVPQDSDALGRRAHLWRILVERAEAEAAKHSNQVFLLRYEELLERPADVLARLYAHIGAPSPEAPIDVSDVRPQKRDAYRGFTETEAASIDQICGPTNAAAAWRTPASGP